MLYVDDAVSANVFAMNYKGQFKGRYFDCGTGSNISLNEVRKIVMKHFPEVKFDYVDPRPGDVLLTKANSDELKNIGWQAQISIEKGIDSCFNKLKGEKNVNFIR